MKNKIKMNLYFFRLSAMEPIYGTDYGTSR